MFSLLGEIFRQKENKSHAMLSFRQFPPDRSKAY
jgi:hypothetical protein